MRIAFIASESNPYCKTGGLADVVYSLAKELKIAGHEVIVILPYYESVQKIQAKFKAMFNVNLSWRNHNACIYETETDGIPFYFVGEDFYFTRNNIYGYGDDGERFAFFDLAAIRFLEEINFKPDIVHVHDWQSALIPFLMYKQGSLPGAKTMLTIHNPAFRGLLDDSALKELYNIDATREEIGAMHVYGKVSTLKAGILYSDIVTTVSPTHAKELSVDNAYEIGDALVGKGKAFVGVVNGVDTDEFNPKTDKTIAKNFDAKTYKKAKKACKDQLFRDFGLEPQDGPTFVLVSRLYEQKGIPLVIDVTSHIVERGGNVLILGSGEQSYCDAFHDLHNRYPEHVAIYVGYSAKMAHSCYAGGDFFLMPSSFEPCGISQMIAHVYGTLPIARDTGGLHDTISDNVDGFLFRDYDVGGLTYGVDQALDLYYGDPDRMKAMQIDAMKRDHSWKKSADKYIELYQQILK